MTVQYSEYLANAARFRCQMGLARHDADFGTTGNEGTHFDLKKWGQNIWTQSKERAYNILELWAMSQMGRHFSSQSAMLQGRRAEDFSRVLLKVLHPHTHEGSSTEPAPSIGLSQSELRKSNLPPQMLRPEGVPSRREALKRPAAARILKRPAAVPLKRPAAAAGPSKQPASNLRVS